MSQHQSFYEEEEEESGGEGKHALYVVGYFLLLSIFIVIANMLHVATMQAVFFGMVGAALLLALIIWLAKLLVRSIAAKVQASGLSRREMYRVAIGYNPYATDEDEDEEDEEGPAPVLPSEIIEESPLNLSKRYQPSIRSFLAATVAIIGKRRSGKSNFLAVLAEELARYKLPFALFDSEGEFDALVDEKYLSRPVLAVGAEHDHGSHPHLVTIDREGAYDFGKAIMDGGLQVVIDLQSFADDEEAALVMSEIVDGINDWQQAFHNRDRVPMTVFLDESQKWFPQNREDKVLSAEMQDLLNQAFFGKVVARGGKRGFGLVAAAQRYSQLNKKLLQSDHKFLFLQTEEIDIARYAKLGIPAEQTPTLSQGECYVFGPSVIGMRVMMRQRTSPHGGHTPGLENLDKHTRHLPPLTEVLKRSFSGTLAPPATAQASEAEDQARKREGRRIILGKDQKGKDVTITLDQFYEACERRKTGKSTGYRDLMATFNLTDHYAQEFNRLIVEKLKRDTESLA